MKQTKIAAMNEAIICKYSGKKFIAACQAALSILLAIALVAVYFLDNSGKISIGVAGIVNGFVEGPLAYAVAAAAGIVGGIVLGLVWGLLVNMFAVPAATGKEQRSYLDMSALRVQLDNQRTILCEGDAQIGKLKGRLYVTAGAVEYYAGSENGFTNYFLIPLYEVKGISVSNKKVVISTRMKKFTLKVANYSGRTWKKAIKDAVKFASSAPYAIKASKKAAKKAIKAARRAR